MLRLIGLSVSPATERARWALDHAALTYHFEEYLPQITTPWVRLRTRRLFGPISVPILLGPGVNLPDSWDIAQYAMREQPAARLIPREQHNTVEKMNQLSEQIFYAGRILTVKRTLANDAALQEAIPDLFPAALHPRLVPLARNAYRVLRKKYADPRRSDADQLPLLRELLQQVRQQLNGKPFLLDSGFSYADITIIAALQVIRPVQSRHIPLGPASQSCWTCPELAQEFADLLDWRDSVYGEHRYRTFSGQAVLY